VAKADKKSRHSEPTVHHLRSVHVHHLPPAVDLVVGSPEIGGPVPIEECAAVPAPTEVIPAPTPAPVKTRNAYKQNDAAELMKEFWPPDGPPADMSTPAIRKKLKAMLASHGRSVKELPFRDTINRVLGRRR
jgi:hypothetical protein